MSKNTAEHLLKVEHAAQFLLRAPQATVPEAMRVARFSDNDIVDAKGSDPANLTAADLAVLLSWHQHKKVAGMNKAAKIRAWKDIVDNNWQPPVFSRWTEDDERKLAEACETTIDIGHTALGRMEEMKKKELVLTTVTMSNDEFKVLRQERERRLNSLAQTEDALAAESETFINATTEATEGSD
jgi:hypothetical protein